jgi:glycosyltransferase involved in cell wall biosynthesis
MTSPPLVSIVTPSYNQAAYLLDTLRAVATQDYPRIEHIVMDGGSTDGSVELIQRWVGEGHKITWRSEPDGGQADAINRGAALAHGEIVAWLNSDDVYLDRYVLTDVVAKFSEGVQIVTGGGWYLRDDGEPEEFIPVFPERMDRATLEFVDWLLQPATFIRRDLFRRFPLDTSLHYAFDWDLFIRLAGVTNPTPIFRDIAGYRRHDTGKTISGGGRRQLELLEVTRRYQGRFSRGYLELLPIVLAHQLAGRAPVPIRSRLVGLLNGIAEQSRRLTHGRGIPY